MHQLLIEIYDNLDFVNHLKSYLSIKIVLLDYSFMKPLQIFIALIGLLGIVPLTWQQCFKIVFYLVVFEGAIRKWVIPGAADVIFFCKDLLMVAAYCKFFIQPPQARSRLVEGVLLKFILILASILPIFQIMNPKLGTVAIGFFGVRGYVLYIPMIFLLPSFFKTKDELFIFIRNYLIFCIPVCALAFVQYHSSPESFINRYAGDGNEVMGVALMGSSNNVRAISTFPYITGFTTYLSFIFALVLPLVSYEDKRNNRLLLAAEAALILGAFLTTGSRGPLLFTLILLFLFFIFNKNFWTKGIYKKVLGPGIIFIIIVPILFGSQLNNFLERARQNDDAQGRIGWLYNKILDNLDDESVWGFGTGICHPAEAKLRVLFGVGEKNPVKDILDIETGRVFLELGLIGFILWYLMRVYLIYALWMTFLKLKTVFLKDLALVACVYHLTNLIGGLVYNVTAAVYYWFFAGFILLLPQLDEVEKRKREIQLHKK